MVTSPNAEPLGQPSPSPDLRKKSKGSGRLVVHSLLLIYAAVLAYVVGGLLFPYNVNPDIFFGLSFALLFFALGQCIYELGVPKAILFFLISTVVGFGVEVLGTNTGLPFGKYYYGDFLGEKVFGVPVVVPLVWFVISYITFSITSSFATGRRDSSGVVKVGRLNQILALIIVASLGAVAWDLMVDPMFSKYGYWTWETTSAPSLSGVPLTNFLGWFVVAFLMLAIFVGLAKKIFHSSSSFSPASLRRAINTTDSRIAYALLMIDAAIANSTIGSSHYIVVVIGVVAMSSFLLLTMKPHGTRDVANPKFSRTS